MPPRRSRASQATSPELTATPVPRPRRRRVTQPAPEPAPAPEEQPPAAAAPEPPVAQQPVPPPPLDYRIYNAHPLAFIPTELFSPEEAEHENKIYVSRRTYQVLADEDAPLLAVEIRQPGSLATILATIEGTHLGEPNDVYLPHILMERLGNPTQINLLLVRTPLPIITKVELRIMDNDFALEEPVEAIQDYLKNYYVLEEGTTLNIQNEAMGLTVPVYIEKIHPELRGRIQNGEVELELLRIQTEEALPAPPSAPANSIEQPEGPIPMLPGVDLPEIYRPREPPKLPTQDEKEKMRLARLARFSSP